MSKASQVRSNSAKEYYEIRYRSTKTGRFVASPKKPADMKSPHEVIKEKYGNAIKRLGAT